MLREARLTSTADFRRTYASGRRVATGPVVAHVVSTGESRPARVGFAASKAIGGAVRRNRAKRRLREAVRALGRPLEDGVDAVFVATAGTNPAEFQELVDNLRDVVEKSGAISV